jgi:hypothetical protein
MAISLTTPLTTSGGLPVSEVGETVKLIARGATAVATDTHHPAVYYYVYSKPPGSALKTLTELTELTNYTSGLTTFYSGPLDLTTAREDIRLPVASDHTASFVPDAPGKYVLRAYDVTQYRFLPHYGGHIPATGEVAELDNEEAALPAYAGGTAQAASADLTVWVAEDVVFTIGVEPDTAVLTVRTFSDTIDQSDPKLVKLVAADTKLAKIAATSRDVILSVDAIRQLSAPYTTTTFAKDALIGWGTIDGASPSPRLWDMITAFTTHKTQTFSYTTHSGADATNTIAAASATDLATSITLLNDLRAKYELHRVKTSGSTHIGADAVNTISAPVCTDFTTALALWMDIYSKLTQHATRGAVHNATVGIPVDGDAREWIEPPLYVADLHGKANTLATLYSTHIAKVNNSAPHANADADNVVSAQSFDTDSKQGVYDAINAFASALERHAANLDENGSPAASAYHTNATTIKVPTRASDPASAHRTLVWILVRMEDHFLNDTAHGSTALGKEGPNQPNEPRWPYVARVQRAWERAINVVTQTVTDGLNNSAALIHGYGG